MTFTNLPTDRHLVDTRPDGMGTGPHAVTTTGPVHLPYHRLALADPRHRWWRPLVTLVLFLTTYLVLVTGILAVLAGVGLADPRVMDILTTTFDSAEPALDTPWGLALGLGLIALMIPALAIGVRVGERSRLGRLSSVAGRLRGRLLLPMLGLAALVFVPVVVLEATMQWSQGTLSVDLSRTALVMLALGLLVVPFQAAAEEYVFRALPQQVLGAWLRSPWWGILLPVPLFVLGHDYDLAGQLSIAVFALATGILVWRTGGLEAAIALHVVNNLVVCAMGAVGVSPMSTHEVSAWDFWSSNAVTVVFTIVALRLHRRWTRA